jgi:alpha-ketoglutarate-dependent 2,4-dichlorophenoxyacetate dioxygenase
MIQSTKLKFPGGNVHEARPMAITIQPVTPEFAAEIGDVDLSTPLAPSDAKDVLDAFRKYAVLIFPDQRLSADQHLDFARLFGPL